MASTKLISLYKVSVSRITPPKSKDHELACWQLSKRELGMRKCKNTESTKHCSAHSFFSLKLFYPLIFSSTILNVRLRESDLLQAVDVCSTPGKTPVSNLDTGRKRCREGKPQTWMDVLHLVLSAANCQSVTSSTFCLPQWGCLCPGCSTGQLLMSR